MDVFEQIIAWTEELRKGYIQPWENRRQDYAYKKYVERPVINSLLQSKIPIHANGKYLDIGCGDGNETFYIQKRLVRLGHRGILYAFDPQENLIRIAQKRNFRLYGYIPIVFDCGYLDVLAEKYNLEESVDLVTSTVVLQDLPDPKQFIESIHKCLKIGAIAIFSLVHPAFAESLLKKGALKIKFPVYKDYWQWAAAFPIVEEKQKTFNVPYFHRTIDDYLKIFNSLFTDITYLEGAPSKRNIKFYQNKSISPFYDHLGNVYFPEIIEMPSSLFLIAKK